MSENTLPGVLVGLQERYSDPQDEFYLDTMMHEVRPSVGNFVKTEVIRFRQACSQRLQTKTLRSWPGQFGFKNVRVVSTDLSGIRLIELMACDHFFLERVWIRGPDSISLNPSSVFLSASNTVIPFIEGRPHLIGIISSVPVIITYDVYHIEPPLPPAIRELRWNVAVPEWNHHYQVRSGQAHIREEVIGRNLVRSLCLNLTTVPNGPVLFRIEGTTFPPIQMHQVNPFLWILQFGDRGVNFTHLQGARIEYTTQGEPHRGQFLSYSNRTLIWKRDSLMACVEDPEQE
jgi:hypothetical protein